MILLVLSIKRLFGRGEFHTLCVVHFRDNDCNCGEKCRRNLRAERNFKKFTRELSVFGYVHVMFFRDRDDFKRERVLSLRHDYRSGRCVL